MTTRDDRSQRGFLADLPTGPTSETDADGPGLRDELLDDRGADRACRPTETGPEGCALAALMVLPLPAVVVLLIGTGTPPNQALGLFGLMIGITIGTLWIVVRVLWEPFRRRFPAVHPTERVRWKRLQIVRLGLIGGFNYCVDIGADDDHVHLHLMMPFALLARPMSIPRSAIEWDGGERPRSTFGMAKVRISGKRSRIPAWTLAQ